MHTALVRLLCDLLSDVITRVMTLGMGIRYDEQSIEPESHNKLLLQSQANFLMHCPHFLTDLVCEIPYRSLHTTSSSICAFGSNLQSESKTVMMGLTVCKYARQPADTLREKLRVGADCTASGNVGRA